MAASISLYDSGRDLAAGVLGDSRGSLFNHSNSANIHEHDDKNVCCSNDGCLVGDVGQKLRVPSKIGTTSFEAHFKNRSTVANNNRTTYQQIQKKLSVYDRNNGTDFSKTFGRNFWFSKMMGSSITKGTVIDFLDRQLPAQKAKAAEQKKPSILASLFGNWSFSTSKREVTTKKTTAGGAWDEATEGAGKTKQVAAKTTKELAPAFLKFAERIRESGGQPYSKFQEFKNTKSINLSDGERQIIEMLDQHAQKHPAFLKKLDHLEK